TDQLAAAKAKVIANTILLSEPQVDPGYQYIVKLLDLAQKAAQPGAPADPSASPAAAPPAEGFAPIVALLKDAESTLNTDRKLAESYAKAGNVVQPMLFVLGEPRGRPDKPLPPFAVKNAIATPKGSGESFGFLTSAVRLPIEPVGTVAAGLGHLNTVSDVDGGVRQEPLVLQYFDQLFPSMSMMIAARSLNLTAADIKVQRGESVSLGRLRIGTDPAAQMYTYFYKDRDNRPAFSVASFYDVANGKIPAANYADRIVLIGATAPGLGATQVTPISPSMAPVLTLAHSVSSILQEHFFVAPTWGHWIEMLLFLLVAAYLIVLLPRLAAGPALAISGAAFVALIALHFGLMVGGGMWLQLMLPATLLLVGHGALVSKRFIITERAKVKSDETSA